MPLKRPAAGGESCGAGFFVLVAWVILKGSIGMTIYEVSQRYSIPIELLYAYESWGLFNSEGKPGERQYDDMDLERLSLMITLRDAGFDKEEIKTYMRLLLEGESTEKQRVKMLNQRRKAALEEIHYKEAQLEKLDYLRYNI